jgi:hypothetical protein
MKNIFFVMFFLIFFACGEEENTRTPIDSPMGKPGTVSETGTERLPGGVNISYKIPDSPGLLAIKAVYSTASGRHEVVASYYENFLTIKGYADTLEHEAQVFVINRAQELSDPVTVKFRPLESPLSKVIKSIKIEPDFGGAYFEWLNEDEANFIFEFMTENKGVMTAVNILQSDKKSMNYALRGYPPQPRQFALQVSDNFGNSSGLIAPAEGEITPLPEEELDKSIMSVMRLDNDTRLDAWGAQDAFLVDGDVSTFAHSPAGGCPGAFTIDLGRYYTLSRFKVHLRYTTNNYYIGGNVKKMEVFGCNSDVPLASGSWTDWKRIMDCEIVKPSGLSGTSVTNEDMKVARNGFEFIFPKSVPSVRYIRFNVPTPTFGGNSNFFYLSELTFFGVNSE